MPDSQDQLCSFGPEYGRRYRSNLDALARHQPAWADLLNATALPSRIEPATGRDGGDTFLLSDSAGKSCWLGQTSMPSISSEALAQSVTDTGGNVLMPSILSGLEPIVIARKLGRHCAVFVRQVDPLPLKLAMYLHDYVPLLESGRLVFVGDDAESPTNGGEPPSATTGSGPPTRGESLVDFFHRNHGYEFPARMIRVPQLSDADLGKIQNMVETAGQAVAKMHRVAVDESARAMASRSLGELSTKPRVAVITVDARPPTLRSVQAIGSALNALGWPHATCAPDSPRNCHIAARLSAIETVEADVVLFVNCSPGPLVKMLPPSLPLVAWYLPESAVGAAFEGALDANFLVCVATPELFKAALHAGCKPDRVERIDVGARIDPRTEAPIDTSGLTTAEYNVGLVLDLPSDTPEAANVTLTSHLQLYDALRDQCRSRIDDYSDESAPEFLVRAEESSGVRLTDDVLRGQFVALARACIAPVAVVGRVIRSLQEGGSSFGLWGRCGASFDGLPELETHSLTDADDAARLFHRCRIVVIPLPTPGTTQLLLEGLLAGVTMVCRQPRGGVEADYPKLASVLCDVHWFTSASQVGAIVARLLASGSDQTRHAGPVARSIEEDHSVRRRLTQIMSLLNVPHRGCAG